MKKPVLSVCIITYNHIQYIREALDSILAQEVHVPWQLIIADDCSTDGTREVLLEYQQKYPDVIHLILQKRNVGPERNWLDLIAYPKSTYLLYGEADDYFTDNTKLQRQVDFLEAHRDVSLCFHPVRIVYEDGSRPDELFPTPEQRAHKTTLQFEDLLRGNFIQTNSAMYRWRFIKENVKDVFPKRIAPGDWFLHLLHAEVGKIGYIDRPMAVYRRHPGGLWWNAYKNKDQLWKKHGATHLAFFLELLKRCAGSATAAAIVYEHISDMLATFIAFDEKYTDKLLQEVLSQFPRNVEAVVLSQAYSLRTKKGIIQSKDAELGDKAQESLRLHQIIQDKNVRIGQLEQQLQTIQASRFWKARNTIAKLTGRKVV
ncbi:MAG TPA: glycosyltransferase [Candidatus Saccharimonadales bacterium]|nr:glycosyltransferase [Candidatus Saccharimonadales bacterium]